MAIVTGGTRGIGLAIARGLVARGAKVVVSGRNADAIAAVRDELGDAVTGVSGDVAEEGVAEELVRTATKNYGGLAVLINNAGMGTFKAVADMSPAEWHRLIAMMLTTRRPNRWIVIAGQAASAPSTR